MLALVVDDDPRTLDATSLLLASWGCRIVTARTAQEAREVAVAQESLPEVLVVDYDLGAGPNGIDVIDSIESSFGRKIPTLLLSSDSGLALERDSAERGLRVLYKPVPPSLLRAAFDAATRSRAGTRG